MKAVGAQKGLEYVSGLVAGAIEQLEHLEGWSMEILGVLAHRPHALVAVEEPYVTSKHSIRGAKIGP